FDQIATFQEGAVAGGPVDVGSSVEADGTGQSVAVGGGRPRAGATETKANGEYPHVGVPSPEECHCGGDVGVDALRGRLWHMGRVVEVLAAGADAGRPSEVVDRH